MVFRLQRYLLRLASVLVSAAAAAAAAALAAVAAAAIVAAAIAVSAAAANFFYRHLRLLHRRSECPKLHLLALLSVELHPSELRRATLLHHADCARHWKAPDSDHL